MILISSPLLSSCAVQMSLLEQPRLSYGLIIQGGDISFVPGLEDFINGVLRNSILERYTLPGGYTLPIAPGGGHEVRLSLQPVFHKCHAAFYGINQPHSALWSPVSCTCGLLHYNFQQVVLWKTTCLKGTPQAVSALEEEEPNLQLQPEHFNIQSVLSLRERFVRQHALRGPHQQ